MTLDLHSNAFSGMGCPCEISIYADSANAAREAFALGMDEVARLDQKYSHYRTDSWLAGFQERASQSDSAEADAETAVLLDYAASLFELSDGAFDITTRPLTALWDAISAIPSSEQIRAILDRTGWRRVSWDGQVLRMPPGMTLDLGGLVKEYASDRIAGLLWQAGIRHGYVDLGGDFHFLGPHPDGSPWRVGIRNPSDRDSAIATIAIGKGGLASSGDYERCTEIDGRRYSHLIDARTGWPVDSDHDGALSAVSVTAPNCLVAGSAATIAMLYQGERAQSFLDNSGLAWMSVTRSGSIQGAIQSPEVKCNARPVC